MKFDKVLKFGFMFAVISLSSFAANAESFFGKGWCMIETLPCKDGQTISCSAEGYNGGFCIADKEGKFYTVTCRANGGYGFTGSTVRRSCERKRSFLGINL